MDPGASSPVPGTLAGASQALKVKTGSAIGDAECEVHGIPLGDLVTLESLCPP